jgi:hypothetical protein
MTKKCFSGHDTALILYLLLSMTLWELKIKYKVVLVSEFCQNSVALWISYGRTQRRSQDFLRESDQAPLPTTSRPEHYF